MTPNNYFSIPGLPPNIEHAACIAFGCLPSKLHSRSRKGVLPNTRQAVMWYEKKYLHKSLFAVAERFGKTHSTAIHAIDTIDNMIHTDKIFKEKINEMLRLMGRNPV